GNGWQPLPYKADTAHSVAFTRVQESKEWRDLASDGYALYDACFPHTSQLRTVMDNLVPGSRIDFHWTERSGPGWVSHVPWSLMYKAPVDVTGKAHADAENFLG